jgi:hypothetical protein
MLLKFLQYCFGNISQVRNDWLVGTFKITILSLLDMLFLAFTEEF